MNHAGSTKDEHYYIASGAENKMYVLRYHCDEQWFVGDNVVFDAKLEKPKDFDGTFYYYKRPTKVKIL